MKNPHLLLYSYLEKEKRIWLKIHNKYILIILYNIDVKYFQKIKTILSFYDMKLFYKKETKDALKGILSKQQEWKNGHFFAFLWHGKNINPIPQLKINSPSPFWSILLFGVLQKLNTLPLDWLTWEMVPQSNPASAIA